MNKFNKKIKSINQSTGEISEITRGEQLNMSLIELHIFGAMTQAEQKIIGRRLDKLLIAK